MLTDKDTENNILTTDRANIRSVVDEIIAVDIPAEFSKMERSRWLKTSMRKHISGDFLYIDTDTIICASLSEIDNISSEISRGWGGVDYNLPIEGTRFLEVNSLTKKIFGEELKPGTEQFNSGVMLVNDCTEMHTFFETWHKNWLISRSKGVCTDQQSLAYTCSILGNLEELDNTWNLQMPTNKSDFSNVKIAHYYMPKKLGYPAPLIDTGDYYKIKIARAIPSEIDTEIRAFGDKYSNMLIECYFQYENAYNFALWACKNNPPIYKLLNKVSGLMMRMFMK